MQQNIKLFTDLIFCIFHILFNYPRWMEIVWLPSASEVGSVPLFTWPNLNMRDLKTTLRSGFSKLGLCSTNLFVFELLDLNKMRDIADLKRLSEKEVKTKMLKINKILLLSSICVIFSTKHQLLTNSPCWLIDCIDVDVVFAPRKDFLYYV